MEDECIPVRMEQNRMEYNAFVSLDMRKRELMNMVEESARQQSKLLYRNQSSVGFYLTTLGILSYNF